MDKTHEIATAIAQKARSLLGVSDVLVPQDVDYPALKLSAFSHASAPASSLDERKWSATSLPPSSPTR